MADSRGFTLVELLASIVIIALLAALATPSFIAMMRDRRVARAAVMLADTYREARTRAMARGNTVMVRWTASGAKGTIEMRETIMLPAGMGTVKGCSTADWSTTSVDSREVRRFDFASSSYELAELKLVTEAGVDALYGETCFGQDRRTYVRYANASPFVALTGVPRYEVTNSLTGFKRVVHLPPNGIARVGL